MSILEHIANRGRLSESLTRRIIYTLIDVMQCFHERDFVHRDLKPENVVFAQRNDLSDIRLIDFGESIHVEAQGSYNQFGTLSFCLSL